MTIFGSAVTLGKAANPTMVSLVLILRYSERPMGQYFRAIGLYTQTGGSGRMASLAKLEYHWNNDSVMMLLYPSCHEDVHAVGWNPGLSFPGSWRCGIVDR